MPHAAALLTDGANVNRTPTLNEFGLSQTQLVRYQFDNNGYVLVQKLGGWQKFYPSALPAIVRALWAWEDVNSNAYLGYGTQTAGGQAHLGVITSGTLTDITPTSTTDNVTPAAAATSGSATVVLTDATTMNLTSQDAVYIKTHISVGGLVLFGEYPITAVGASTYSVTAVDTLGNPVAATSTSSTTTVESFSVSNGSPVITVTLASHGYVVGDTYTCLVPTTLGGITVSGDYPIIGVASSNVFTILASANATSNATLSINGGNARYLYNFHNGALPVRGTAITATDWTQANWGSTFLACPVGGPIYQWTPQQTGLTATVLPYGPTINDGMFVAMPQKQIVAWGSSFTGVQDPLLIRWCDANNYNVWVGTILNQAGSYRLPRGSKIVGCIQGPQQGLIWTDISLWSMQYIGAPLVYSFNEVGTGCGLISRKAAASISGVVYWMGPTQFFTLDANGVQAVSCPIWDVIFQELDTANVDKIRVAVNSRFNEIAWYYPTATSGGEVAAYVKYNVALGLWDYGTLARSAWIDQSVLGAPIGADPGTLLLQQHETSNNADGAALISSFQTGYWALSEGEEMNFVDQVWPDFRYGDLGASQNATLTITFYGANYPNDTPTTYGPYTCTSATQYFSPRIRNRLLSMSVQSSDVGSFWRLGRTRYRSCPSGKF